MKYRIIYADPPWNYNARNNPKTKFGGGAIGHYPLMKPEEIAALPVESIADDNAALFLWATFPRLQDAFTVMQAWGFEYKTAGFNWLKTNPKNDRAFFGIGYYTKSNAEVCLLGVKGKMKPVSNLVSSVIVAPRAKHSEKPAEAREKIVQLFGDLPRIELFARSRFDGWHAWGNEIKSDIDLLA